MDVRFWLFFLSLKSSGFGSKLPFVTVLFVAVISSGELGDGGEFDRVVSVETFCDQRLPVGGG